MGVDVIVQLILKERIIYKPILNTLTININQRNKMQRNPNSPRQGIQSGNQSTRELMTTYNINEEQVIDAVHNEDEEPRVDNLEEEEEEMMESGQANNNGDYNNIRDNYQKRVAMHQSKLEQARLHMVYMRMMDNSYIQPPAKQKLHIRFLNAMDRVLPVLAPQSNFLLFWNFVIMIVLLFQFFQAPVAIFLTASVYEAQTNSGLGLTVNAFCLFLIYIDTFLVRVSIAYYHKGKLISTRVSIFNQYLKPELILNVIAVVSLTIYIGSHNYRLVYIKLLFYLRIYSLNMIDKQILHNLQFLGLRYAVYRLGKLMIMLWFITSLAATIFFAIDYYYYLEQGYYYHNGWLWLTNSEAVGNLDIINNSDWFVWYTYALYWAIQTASTVGYGDLTPMNPVQVLFVVFNILLMTILFAFYVNTIWRILEDLHNNSIQFSSIWYQYKKYMRKNKELTKQLKQRISNCLYELWEDKINEEIQQEIISKKISKQLQDAFYVEYKSVFYSNASIFSMISCPTIGMKDVMKEFVDIIENYNVSEGINVYVEGEFDQFMYYLRKGQVELNVSGSGLCKVLDHGNSFGEEEFFRKIARNHTAEAKSFAKMWRISYTNFSAVLRRYPYLNQRYNELSYRIIMEKSPLFLNLQCWKCSSKFHFLNQCPQINSWRDRMSVGRNSLVNHLLQYVIPGVSERRHYVRSKVQSVSNKNVGKILKFRESLNRIQSVEHIPYYFVEFNIGA